MLDMGYEISSKTCALSYIDESNCVLINEDSEKKIKMSLQNFINYNCEYYGSSFDGRVRGAQVALGMKYKLPIIVEESKEMVFFPTRSYTSPDCSWIALNNIKKYEATYPYTTVTFTSGKQCTFNISIESFENQVLRATKLLLSLKNRKES